MRKVVVVLSLVMILSLALSGVSSAATLDVPASYPTIQAAIDAAAWGDTVLVAPGEYVQSISLKPGVTVQSSQGPEVTKICGDGSWYKYSWINYSVFGASSSTISGFTIYGSNIGILNMATALSVKDNIITSNYLYGIANGDP